MGPADDGSEHGEVPDMASLELAATWTAGQWDTAGPDAPPRTSFGPLASHGPSYEDLCRAHIEVLHFVSACCAHQML